MSARSQDRGQRLSDGTALVLTAASLALAVTVSRPTWLTRIAAIPSNQAIELSVEAAAPTPAAPPPAVPPPVPMHHAARRAVVTEPAVLPSAAEQAAPEDAALVPAAAPAQAARPTSHADIEAEYAAQLHADIDRRTRPPDSPKYRLHHPAGEVHVRFLVTRGGLPKGCAVDRSSGSSILDEAAVSIVAAGHYPPMPAAAFAGEAEHLFVVTIEFRPAGAI
jgi:protein TonB